MAEAGEREQQAEPAAPAPTGAAPALAGGVSDSALAGAGQSRPPLNRGTVMRLQGSAGQEVGLINWFAVHATSMGNDNLLISGDNKGYASYLFEKLKGTNYTAA